MLGFLPQVIGFVQKQQSYFITAVSSIALTVIIIFAVLFSRTWAVDTGSIIVAVKSVSELATSKHEVETVVPSFSQRLLPVLKSKVLYIAHGEVTIGFNLEDMQGEDLQIDQEQKEIVIHMPSLKVLNTKIDVEKSVLYDFNKGLLSLGPALVSLLDQAQKESIDNINEAACKPWLIENANILAAKSIENVLVQGILKNKGYEVDVEVAPLDPKQCVDDFVQEI